MSVRAAGDAALLVEAGAEPGAAARLRAVILGQNFPGIADVIPGAETVLVILGSGGLGLRDLAGRLQTLVASGVDEVRWGKRGWWGG